MTVTEAMIKGWIAVKTAALLDGARRVIPVDQLGAAVLGVAIGVFRSAGRDDVAIRSALEQQLVAARASAPAASAGTAGTSSSA
jgi:hypothetical protein